MLDLPRLRISKYAEQDEVRAAEESRSHCSAPQGEENKMKTLYLIIVFGQCLPQSYRPDTISYSCVGPKEAPVSYAFGVTAEQVLAEQGKLPKGTWKLYAGQCAADTREMSNLCMGPCPYTYRACDFKPASVSTRTVTVTEFSEGSPHPRP